MDGAFDAFETLSCFKITSLKIFDSPIAVVDQKLQQICHWTDQPTHYELSFATKDMQDIP